MYSYFINNVTPSPTTSHQEAGAQTVTRLKCEQNSRKLGDLSSSYKLKFFPGKQILSV